MAKYTQLSQCKAHPAVWMRVANALHWGSGLNFLLKKCGISRKDWDENIEWVEATYPKTDSFKKDGGAAKYNPLDNNFNPSTIEPYAG